MPSPWPATATSPSRPLAFNTYVSYRAIHRLLAPRIDAEELDPLAAFILDFLLYHHGAAARSVIRDEMALPESTPTSALKRLKQADLVVASRGRDDRRSSVLELTPRGRNVAAWVRQHVDEIERDAAQSRAGRAPARAWRRVRRRRRGPSRRCAGRRA